MIKLFNPNCQLECGYLSSMISPYGVVKGALHVGCLWSVPMNGVFYRFGCTSKQITMGMAIFLFSVGKLLVVFQ